MKSLPWGAPNNFSGHSCDNTFWGSEVLKPREITQLVTTDPGTGVSKAKVTEELLILAVDDKGTLG